MFDDMISAIQEDTVRLLYHVQVEQKETEFPEPEQFREIERVVLLRVIDRKWMDHIDDIWHCRFPVYPSMNAAAGLLRLCSVLDSAIS